MPKMGVYLWGVLIFWSLGLVASPPSSPKAPSPSKEKATPQGNKKQKKRRKEESKKQKKLSQGEEEIVVTATRREARTFEVPYQVLLWTSESVVHQSQSRSIPHALEEDPTILGQKTANFYGSPYIRGFTGFRNLFLIDGFRLNNSVFREGPNQYWATVDPFLVGRMEVVKGPASVLYGSDAIGGTVNVITREVPLDPKVAGFWWRRRGVWRFGSADTSHTLRAEVMGQWNQQLTFLGGFSYKDYGDVVAGRHVGEQPYTGYSQWDGDSKFSYYLSKKSRITVAYQGTRIKDAWRTHKTIYGISWEGTTVGSELARILQQERHLIYGKWQAKEVSSLLDRVELGVSLHAQREYRTRVKSSGGDRQGFQVYTLGTIGQANFALQQGKLGEITAGFEYYRDFVNSFRRDYNADGTLKRIRIQGPIGDDATYDLLGIFLQYELELWRDRLMLILGGRYTYARASADKVEDPQTKNQISISDTFQDLVGSGRLLLFLIPERANLFLGVSQAFRAPNLSDLTRLDTARSNEIETPSPGLDPEHFLTLEVGSKWRYDTWRFEISYYYTFISDMIIRFPTGRVISGDNEVQKANAGDGYVHGVEIYSSLLLSRGGPGKLWKPFPSTWGHWSLFAGVGWQEGKVDTFPTSAPVKRREHLSRLLPTKATFGLKWQSPNRRIWWEVYVQIADRQDRLNTRDRRDTQRIPPNGTPGYGIVTVRGGFRLGENLIISLAVENVGNKDYRIHGSGVNQPGTNFLFQVDWRF